ncbi:arginyltransferase [Marinagarivorans algicola]|uniref:arginyltransferase n=1 Tax=Marinagarivorans algicola TaxID=1513270 RepID=UPI00373567BE
MNELANLKLYATAEHPCSYLKDQQASTIFIDPAANLDVNVYSALSELGFRRSGGHIYRPHCADCAACISVRVPVQAFALTRTHKRCLKRNSDLTITATAHPNIDEHYALYERYIHARHSDGDMYPPNRQQYIDFLNNPLGCTHYIEMRKQGKLIGCAVSDRLSNGLSAIYTYFCPTQTTRSLGRFAILHQIQKAQNLGLPYLYLGYWIRNCQKMTYKSEYQPFEKLIDRQWVLGAS